VDIAVVNVWGVRQYQNILKILNLHLLQDCSAYVIDLDFHLLQIHICCEADNTIYMLHRVRDYLSL